MQGADRREHARILHRSRPVGHRHRSLPLEGLRRQNDDINNLQRGNYRGLLQNKTRGIKAKVAY